ncbi:NADase-type glycan-binding domain-containing protein [Streptomyces celluloflavus]|uniref:NADase-type glycan-binding domain-containing protein n=1 Tax=Streptomyces celluloflavus TaxID=58344 RepID=UPI003666A69B
MTAPTTACPDCGTPARQTGQSFCDSCGAFLRWDTPTRPSGADTATPGAAPGAASGTAPGPAPADDDPTLPIPATPADGPAPATPATGHPAPPPHPATAMPPAAGPVDSAPSFGPPPPSFGPPPAYGPPPGADPRQPHGATGGPGYGPATGAPGPAASGHHSEEPPMSPPATGTPLSDTAVRALLVPVPEASPAAPPQAPGTVLPGRPEAARPQVRTPHAAVGPEQGPPCPGCGTPNEPRRYFCRSCTSLLKDRGELPAEGPYAGQRPRLGRGRSRWIVRVAVAAGVAALVVGGIFGGPPAARAVQDHFAKRVPVHPTTWKASHSDAKQGPDRAFDGYSNTWWGTGYSGSAAGQWLEAGFGQPTDLLAVLITPGTSPRAAQAAAQARPQEFDLIVTDSAGKAYTSHHRINDGGVQRLDVRVRDATTVRLVLRAAYGATGNKEVAIAELEFFGRSAT